MINFGDGNDRLAWGEQVPPGHGESAPPADNDYCGCGRHRSMSEGRKTCRGCGRPLDGETRWAAVRRTGGVTPSERALINLLPPNYRVVRTFEDGWLIEGRDVAGRTLDGHVIPGLVSAGAVARELTEEERAGDWIPGLVPSLVSDAEVIPGE